LTAAQVNMLLGRTHDASTSSSPRWTAIRIRLGLDDDRDDIPALSLPTREPVADNDPTNVATPYYTFTLAFIPT
jgi:hypothetical protein